MTTFGACLWLLSAPEIPVTGSHPAAFTVGLLQVGIPVAFDRFEDAIPAAHAVVLTTLRRIRKTPGLSPVRPQVKPWPPHSSGQSDF
jgi:hypothetical protein